MPSIRAKVSVNRVGDKNHLRIEWIEVGDEEDVGSVLFVEELIMGPESQRGAYVSRMRFQGGEAFPGTFWIDENGKRHFIVDAEAGDVASIGVGL